MFELRGLSRDQLRSELESSPLGKILASEFRQHDVPIEPVSSYYTMPVRQRLDEPPDYKGFWTGAKRLPAAVDAGSPVSVPALLIKKQGDYPPFWTKDMSFIAVMEAIYERVRTKSSQMK